MVTRNGDLFCSMGVMGGFNVSPRSFLHVSYEAFSPRSRAQTDYLLSLRFRDISNRKVMFRYISTCLYKASFRLRASLA
jgi:hypothetical protein